MASCTFGHPIRSAHIRRNDRPARPLGGPRTGSHIPRPTIAAATGAGSATPKHGRSDVASVRRSSIVDYRRIGPSRFCPATTSSMHCSASAACMRAFPIRRSRRPIRWSLPTSRNYARSSSCLRPAWCSPPTACDTVVRLKPCCPRASNWW